MAVRTPRSPDLTSRSSKASHHVEATPQSVKQTDGVNGDQSSKERCHPESSGRALEKKLALDLVAKREEHNAHIPLMAIFMDAMSSRGASRPDFSYNQNDDCLFEVTFEFNVPAKYSNGQTEGYAMITSESCFTIAQAEHSVIKFAPQHLFEVHGIDLMDYSSMLSQKYDEEVN